MILETIILNIHLQSENGTIYSAIDYYFLNTTFYNKNLNKTVMCGVSN